MSDDIVDRLRKEHQKRRKWKAWPGSNLDTALAEAALEIKRLRKIKNEEPVTLLVAPIGPKIAFPSKPVKFTKNQHQNWESESVTWESLDTSGEIRAAEVIFNLSRHTIVPLDFPSPFNKGDSFHLSMQINEQTMDALLDYPEDDSD